jgi:hypothetical protein
MRRSPAAVVSSLFFAAGPGTVAGLVPYWINGWQVHEPFPGAAMLPIRVLGALLVLAGGVVVVGAFLEFVVEGWGTPIPVAAARTCPAGGRDSTPTSADVPQSSLPVRAAVTMSDRPGQKTGVPMSELV